MKIAKIISVSIMLIMLIFTVNWVYNSEHNNFIYCRNLSKMGYESYQDIATHKDCRINDYDSWGIKSFYKIYNDTCRLEKLELENYGFNCVWGSGGYFKTLLRFGLLGFLICMLAMIIFSKEEHETNNRINN